MIYDKLCNTQKGFFSLMEINGNNHNNDREITDNVTHLTDNLNKLSALLKKEMGT